jgi:transposase-like protein
MTKIILVHELLEGGVSKSHIARHLSVSSRTIIRWSQAIDTYGNLEAFLEKCQQAKKGPRQDDRLMQSSSVGSVHCESNTIYVVS